MLSPLRLARNCLFRPSSFRALLAQSPPIRYPPRIGVTVRYCSTETTTLPRTQLFTNKMDVCPAPVKEKYERLPTFAVPQHYEIKIVPDMQTFAFTGSVSMTIRILEPTDFLKVHMVSIKLDSVKLTLEDGKVLKDLSHTYDPKFNIATINLGNMVRPQTVILSLDYTGEINDKMRGFYRSSYKDEHNQEKFLASTQFESTYARYAFPCFDEPIYKATFDISIVADPGMSAISNMPAVSTTPCDFKGVKKVWIKFDRTPQMSSYLVAFVVGELEYIQTCSKSGTIIRVFTVPGKRSQGIYSLDLAAKAIDWYNEWFGIDYPLPKCDLIAIPDFSMGAMENWGLVTYREVALLVDPAKSSTRQKSRVALVVAHELAHFWFGNLVTMKWWTDLWLKEGFASFMEYLFVGTNYPEFKIWEHFVNDELAQGFGLDALRNSHPIEVEIDDPCELEEIYDNITYAKSNAVNRMLFHYLGEETFQAGLRLYLKKFQYDNAVTLDLWNALGDASQQNVAKLMSGWTKQMGYPVITVTDKQQGKNRILSLSQKRFIADGGEDPENSLWQVPITVCVGSKPSEVKGKFLLVGRDQDIEVPDVAEGEWVKLNAGASGFYRVDHSQEMLKAMIPDISNGKMPLLDRFSIVNDLFALVQAGRVRASSFLSVLGAMHNEEGYIVWQSLAGGIDDISNVLHYAPDPSLTKRFNSFVVRTMENLGQRLGWDCHEGEDSQRAILRSVVHGRLMRAGHDGTIRKASTLFADHVQSKRPLHPDLRLCIFTAAVRNGGETAFNQLMQIFETAGFPEVERNCIIALSQTQDPNLLQRLFKYAIHDGKARAQDHMLFFYGASTSKTGQAFLWQYFKENMAYLVEKFGGVGSGLFQRCLKLSIERQCTEEFAQEVEKFFCHSLSPQDLKTLDRPIRQATEAVRLNQKLLQSNLQDIQQFLSKEGL
uniref:Aminopeptidase n=1 Tax=Haemonchus contortus TaxID=6289 RepID=U6NX93_HAECO|nr:aminopeptidase [Haemonchus contortus]CDJ85176.1 Peptidase M1 domain containing protein [Haemonchus contortus]